MQALESLNDSQVNDFLSGKTPLNLSMRLGDHMMLIQLQLSTVNASGSSSSQSSSGPRTRGLVRSRTSNSKQAIGTNADVTTAKTTERSNYTSSESTPNKYQSTTKPISSQEYTMNVPAPSTVIATQQQHQTPIRTVNQTNVQAGGQRDLTLSSGEFENLRNIVNSLNNRRNGLTTDGNGNADMGTTSDTPNALLEQSPIKSLSNLVSSPIKTTPIKTIPIPAVSAAGTSMNVAQILAPDIEVSDSRSIICTDPITAKLTSCLCKRLDANCNSNGCDTHCQLQRPNRDTKTSTNTTVSNREKVICQWMRQNRDAKTSNRTEVVVNSAERAPKTVSGQQQPNSSAQQSSSPNDGRSVRSSSLLHRTLHNPIARAKLSHGHQHQHSHHHSHRHSSHASTSFRRSKSSDSIHFTEQSTTRSSATQTATCSTANNAIDISETIVNGGTTTARSTGTLAEASRNLTKTLRKLSKEVFTNKMDVATITGDESPRSCNGAGSQQLTSSGAKSTSTSGSNGAGIGSGAVIESMRSHGKGIYSGTFSGTLNPALQDRYGRPKRDISTVIHILNDLLSATPQYSRGARISFEPTSTTRTVKHVSNSLHKNPIILIN